MNTTFIDNWSTQMRKGLLPYLVLTLVKEKEYYGYELIQQLMARFALDITESTIYPLMIRLVKEGLLTHQWVEQPSGIPRKYYFMTDLGRKSYGKMKKDMEIIIKNITKE